MSIFFSILFRIFLAVVIGGLIGLERAGNKHDAGIRTYALVCLGSAISMILSEQLALEYSIDITRIGAQVVSGIGFIGAGCILVNNNKVKGLTTAAGLWTTSCIGLSIGMGYWLIAIISAVFVLLTTKILHPLSVKLQKKKHFNSYTAVFDKELGLSIIDELKKEGLIIDNLTYKNGDICISGMYHNKKEEKFLSIFLDKAKSFSSNYN